MLQYSADQLVFTDESAFFCSTTTRSMGWAWSGRWGGNMYYIQRCELTHLFRLTNSKWWSSVESLSFRPFPFMAFSRSSLLMEVLQGRCSMLLLRGCWTQWIHTQVETLSLWLITAQHITVNTFGGWLRLGMCLHFIVNWYININFSSGMWVEYLSAYSPDYNPIEEAFSCIKAWSCCYRDFMRAELADDDSAEGRMDWCMLLSDVVRAAVTPTKICGCYQHAGYL